MIHKGSYDAVYNALCTRVRNVRLDLVITYGLSAVMQAIEDKASSFQDERLEEIGSSDVSCWIADIEASLKRAVPTEPCFACESGILTIMVNSAGRPPHTVQLRCVTCNGSAVVPAGTKAAHDAFWCRCGNPSRNTIHTWAGTDIYLCADCGAVVQTG